MQVAIQFESNLNSPNQCNPKKKTLDVMDLVVPIIIPLYLCLQAGVQQGSEPPLFMAHKLEIPLQTTYKTSVKLTRSIRRQW